MYTRRPERPADFKQRGKRIIPTWVKLIVFAGLVIWFFAILNLAMNLMEKRVCNFATPERQVQLNCSEVK